METYWGVLYGIAVLTRITSPQSDRRDDLRPSYWGMMRYIFRCREMMTEGCEKYPSGVFKLPRTNGWVVVCCGRQSFEDLRKSSEKIASHEYAEEEVGDVNPGILNSSAEQATVFMSVSHYVSFTGFGVVIASRDPDYISLNVEFTIDLFVTASIINATPYILRPIIGRLVTRFPKFLKRTQDHLSPTIKHRIQQEKWHGKNWTGKPHILILIKEASSSQTPMLHVLCSNSIHAHRLCVRERTLTSTAEKMFTGTITIVIAAN